MKRKLTVELDEDVYEELTALSQALGFSAEETAIYAVRMINACVREGLIEDVPARAWPKEAQLLTRGRVISFPAAKRERIPAGK